MWEAGQARSIADIPRPGPGESERDPEVRCGSGWG